MDSLPGAVQLDGRDLLPMWVSDFDFKCPAEVQQALHSRVDHGIFGYSERDEQYYQAVMDWFSNQHNLQLKREWFTSIEGVVPAVWPYLSSCSASRAMLL